MFFKIGDRGNGVAAIQFALNRIIPIQPLLKTDGIFGPKTDQRVRQHQTKNRLVSDGVVGPLTLDSLFEIVEMTGKTEFTRNEDRARSASLAFAQPASANPFQLQVPGGSFIPPFQKPKQPPISLGPLVSPGLVDFVRRNEAFWKWFYGSPPKPEIPKLNTVVVPVPGPFGPVHLPMAAKLITLPGPPASGANTRIEFGPEGDAFTLSIKGEATVDPIKRKFKEATYGIGLDWVVVKGRAAEIKLGATAQGNNEGEVSAKAEFMLKLSHFSVKHKLGELGVLKGIPYLATAISTEKAIEASGGFKLQLDIKIAKVGPFAINVEAGIAGFTKVGYGPVKQDDGSERYQFFALPFGAKGFAVIGGSF